MEIPIAKPWFGPEEAAALLRPLDAGWVIQGPETAAFEEEFAATVGAAHACAVSSGTAALHLALLAVGVGPGDEVITASHSYISTANTVRHCGAEPVFVDIDPLTYNMDPAGLDAARSPRTRAVLAVHQMGMPCDLDAIQAFAKRHGLALVEDAACAIGSEILDATGAWSPIGGPRGDVACFSFHPRKVVTTGDGGMITTRDPTLDVRMRRLRNQGQEIRDGAITFPEVGFNYRMTDIHAALGRVQLARLPAMIIRRREQAALYTDLIATVTGLVAPAEPAWGLSNWQSYCVRLPAGTDQVAVIQRLADRGVATRGGIMNAHEEAPYLDPARAPLPHSEAARRGCLTLPIYHDLTAADQRRVIEELAEALDAGES